MVLGCIADDFTGATDLSNTLVRAGMRVVQTIGTPAAPLGADVDAVVVALKSRTIEPGDAVALSLQAARWLKGQGARQIYFKYCSTFDSTPRGNIGPVTEALMAELGCRFTIASPAFPDNGRTVFHGHLFVGDRLLSDSSMRHHPLTPMTDADLVRVLQAQCRLKVGLVGYRDVAAGPEAIRARVARLESEGVRIAIADAVSNDDLLRLGPVLAELPLVTGGSGLAMGIPAQFGFQPSNEASRLPAATGLRAVISGSCSEATNRQVAHFKATGRPALAIDPRRIAAGEAVAEEALRWAEPLLQGGPVLVYSTAAPEQVAAVQNTLGVEAAGAMVERCLAAIASGLVQRGVRQLVVAGGETSGACVQALSVQQLQIGAQICPGVPWCHAQAPAAGGEGLHLALKSGNFGADDFFSAAFTLLA